MRRSRCPLWGAWQNRESDMMAWARSRWQREIIHWQAPINDWNLAVLSGPQRADVSSSGWSLWSKGLNEGLGASLKSDSKLATNHFEYVWEPKHKVLSSSWKRSPPR